MAHDDPESIRIGPLVTACAGLAAADPSAGTGEADSGNIAVAPGMLFDRDVVYGRQSAGQKLDILYPSGSGPARPAVLYIHGGGWNGGDKGDDPDMMMDMLRGFACDGFVAASINYRLDTEGRFPAAVEDCTLAVRWLRAHAAAYGVDKTRIGLVGGSAGGYLAAMLAVTAGTREFEGSGGYAEESSAVQAVASVSGPMDLQVNLCAANPEDSHKMVSNFLGVPLTENLELARRASPIAYVRRDTPPTLFVHCKEDPAIDVDQSLRMADALARAGASTNLIVLDGKNHGSDMARTEPVLSELREFFRQVLKPDV